MPIHSHWNQHYVVYLHYSVYILWWWPHISWYIFLQVSKCHSDKVFIQLCFPYISMHGGIQKTRKNPNNKREYYKNRRINNRPFLPFPCFVGRKVNKEGISSPLPSSLLITLIWHAGNMEMLDALKKHCWWIKSQATAYEVIQSECHRCSPEALLMG